VLAEKNIQAKSIIQEDWSRGGDGIVSIKSINSIEDLKGKKVAVPEGTSGDMILGLALEKAGMTKDDVDLVPMDPPTIVSAFSAGKVDAAGTFYPSIDTIKQQVPDLVELAKDSDFADDFSFPNAFVAGNDVDDKTNAEVVAVLRKAMDYRAAHTDEAVKATAEMLDQPVEAVEKDASHNQLLTSKELDGYTQDGTVDSWFSALEDFFVTAGKLDQAVDPKTFYLGDDFVAAGK
jgi:NitT/TauT family transport system substrate-binding protein